MYLTVLCSLHQLKYLPKLLSLCKYIYKNIVIGEDCQICSYSPIVSTYGYNHMIMIRPFQLAFLFLVPRPRQFSSVLEFGKSHCCACAIAHCAHTRWRICSRLAPCLHARAQIIEKRRKLHACGRSAWEAWNRVKYQVSLRALRQFT